MISIHGLNGQAKSQAARRGIRKMAILYGPFIYDALMAFAGPDLVPPLLVYADLMATLDPRNLEVDTASAKCDRRPHAGRAR